MSDTDRTNLADTGSMAPQGGSIQPGTILFGEYEVESVIGEGGMGTVYRARHRVVGERRAIKVIRRELTSDARSQALFYSEARVLAGVDHPAVVKCHDFLRDESGRTFLLMEYVDGRSLAKVLAGGVLSAEDVRALRDRLLEGLAAAHEKGVIHRDLSPDNVLLPQDRPDQAKLIDFGIAKVWTEAAGTVLGHVSGFAGKYAWASPEQMGLFGGNVDARSDLYSLGSVLAYAASGERFSMGTTLAGAVEARRSVPKLPTDLPRDLRSDIEWLLAPDPGERPASARAFRVARGRPAALVSDASARRGRPGASAVAILASALVSGAAVGFGPALYERARRVTAEVPSSLASVEKPAVRSSEASPSADNHLAEREGPRQRVGVEAPLAPTGASAAPGSGVEPAADGPVDPQLPGDVTASEAAAALLKALTLQSAISESDPEPVVPAAGWVQLVVSPAHARVRFDDRLLEPSESGAYVFEAWPGPHRVQVTAGNYRSSSRRVRVSPDEPTALNIELSRSRSEAPPARPVRDIEPLDQTREPPPASDPSEPSLKGELSREGAQARQRAIEAAGSRAREVLDSLLNGGRR